MPIASSIADLYRRLYARGREFLFQREAERIARLRDPVIAHHIEQCLAGADRRLRVLPGVADRDTAVCTATLLRDATMMLLRAESAIRNGEAVPGTRVDDLKGGFLRICDELQIPATTKDDGSRLLITDDPLAFDRMPNEELARSGRALEEVAHAFRTHMNGRSVDAIVRLRRTRVGLTIAVLAGALITVLNCLIIPPNVARGKSVRVSSQGNGSAPVSALVDGVRSGDTAPGSRNTDVFTTQPEPEPWVLIDLGRTYRLREIRVYNRDDDHFDDGLPYRVDISNDGTSFTEVAARPHHFGSWWIDPPWSISVDKPAARYVRVRATRYLALSEIEVLAW